MGLCPLIFIIKAEVQSVFMPANFETVKDLINKHTLNFIPITWKLSMDTAMLFPWPFDEKLPFKIYMMPFSTTALSVVMYFVSIHKFYYIITKLKKWLGFCYKSDCWWNNHDLKRLMSQLFLELHLMQNLYFGWI